VFDVSHVNELLSKVYAPVTILQHLSVPGLGSVVFVADAGHGGFETVGFKADVAQRKVGQPLQFSKSEVLRKECPQVGEKYGDFHTLFPGGLAKVFDLLQVFVGTNKYS